MEQPKKNFSFFERYVSGETNSATWGVVSRGIALANTFLILSALSLYQYGVYQLLLQSYSFLIVFIGVGANVVKNDIFRYAGEGNDSFAKKLYIELTAARTVVGVLLWAVTFFGASLFSFRFGADAIALIRILSFLFLYEILLRLMQPILLLRMKFFVLGTRGVLNKSFQFLLLLFFFFFMHLGVREVILSQVVAAFLSLIFFVPAFIGSYKPWMRVVPAQQGIMLRILMSYGKWAFFRPMLNKATTFVSTWLIKLLISTEAVAIFSVAQSMVGLVKGFTPTGSLSILIPISLQDKERAQRILSYGTKYLVLLSIVLALGGLAVAPPLIYLFFPQYVPALPLFYLMLPHMVINAAGAVATIFFFALRKQKFLFLQSVLSSVSTIGLYLILIPLFGIWGLALEYIITPLFLLGVLYWYIKTIKPGVWIQWSAILSFGKEDKIFLSNIFAQGKVILQGRLLRRKKPALE
ncbi:MAG: hypothetical protein Q8O83_04105 [bacterium]|nr:hypothetical protein [bacterium]